MTGYTKLFGSIIASTIWSEDDQTRIIWITMLAMADQHGEVGASIPGLAKFAKVTVEATETALAKLKAPDTYSRTKDFEGRRIEEIEGGWRILNHAKYRRKASEDDRREKTRIRTQRYRARDADVTLGDAPVTLGDDKQKQKQYTHTPGGIPTFEEIKVYAQTHGILETSAKAFFDHHEDNQLWVNQFDRLINWKSKLKTWAENDRAQKGKKGNATRANSKSSNDRNAGTYNEGKADLYANAAVRGRPLP